MVWSTSVAGFSEDGFPTTIAGTPATVVFASTSESTTLPAATLAPFPISTFPKICAAELIKTPSRTFGCLSPVSLPVPPRVTPVSYTHLTLPTKWTV